MTYTLCGVVKQPSIFKEDDLEKAIGIDKKERKIWTQVHL
jgi:hypothetical protein